MKISVIGSGFGGLAAAIRLQAQGHEVTIVEKRDKLGGRAYVYEQDGFKFDGGPTIITAPWLIDELFTLAGRKTAEYVNLFKINPFYNIRWADGTVFNYNDNKENLLAQIAKIAPDEVGNYKKFSKDLGEIYRVGFELIDQPFDTISLFAVDATSGGLILLGRQSTRGTVACHCAFDTTGTMLAAANYSRMQGDAISVHRIQGNRPGEALTSIVHTGSGPNAQRQERSHAHCVRWTPDNSYLAFAYRGID